MCVIVTQQIMLIVLLCFLLLLNFFCFFTFSLSLSPSTLLQGADIGCVTFNDDTQGVFADDQVNE